MAQFNLIEFRYARKHQPEQYGAEEVSISGTAIVEAGEDAFALADGLIGRAKAVAYNRLGLKPTRECGAADLSTVKVTRVPTAEQQAAAPVVTTKDQPDLSLPDVTVSEIKAAAAESFPALPGEGEPAKRPVGRPAGSGTGTRKTRATKKAEAATTSDVPALPGEETPAIVITGQSGVQAVEMDLPGAEQSEEDAIMALLNQGEEAPAAASDEKEIDNPTLMAAIAEAAREKKAALVNGFLRQVGVDRVLRLDQAQRRDLLAQLAK